MAYVQTIFPGFIPDGYFDNDNVEFLRNKISDILNLEFRQKINVDRASVIRIMQRVLEERLEPIPRMNQRTVMYVTNEFRDHNLEANRNLKWEAHYVESQRLYDPTTERGPDLYNIKITDKLGKNGKIGGTQRFYFTY
jgi:hypothetical protein